MATQYGLLTTGFVPKPLTQIRTDLDNAMRAAFGQSIVLGDKSVLGIIDGIMSERYAELWALAQTVYASQDPNQAAGFALDNVSAITGSLRAPSSFSTVTMYLTGTNASVVTSGSQINTASTAQTFKTSNNATLLTATVWAPNTVYTLGAVVSSLPASQATIRCYYCSQTGTSAASVGPTGTLTGIVDNGVRWDYLGDGAATTTVPATSVSPGNIVGVARDITVIVTPVAGWTNTINVADATAGGLSASDSELRLTRVQEVAGNGTSPADAIRAKILKVTGVKGCTVYANNTDTTDAGGRPPHSVECLVQAGASQDIWNALFANVAAGVATYGTVSGNATDSQGVVHVENFSRPASVTIYVVVNLIKSALLYPTNGDVQVQAAIVTYGATLAVDYDAVASSIGAQAFTVAGVLDVTSVQVYTDIIGTPTAWATGTVYVATIGARSVVTNDGGRQYICTAGGTSGAGSGPLGTGTAIVDGGVTWYFLGNSVQITDHQIVTIATSRITVNSSTGAP